MANLDDLTILLKMVDGTKKATDSAGKNIKSLTKLTELLGKAATAVAGAIVAGFTAAARNGALLAEQLRQVARQTGESTSDISVAFAALRDANPAITIDMLNDSLIDLKERTADAIQGTGPLYGLLQGFNDFNLDLGVDDAREQLANFLREVSKLDNANDRIFALQEVLGDAGREFIPLVNNAELLNTALANITGNANDVAGAINDVDSANMDEAAKATGALSAAWDAFSLRVYANAAPALARLNTALATGLNLITETIKRQGFFGDLSGPIPASPDAPPGWLTAAEVADKAEADVKTYVATVKKVATKKENLTFGSDEIRRAQDLYALEQEVGANRAGLGNELGALQGLDSANDSRFNTPDLALTSTEGSGITQRTQEFEDLQEVLQGITDSFGTAGGAFGAFANLAEAYGSKSFKTFQRLQIALSTAAGISAAIQTLADPTLPFFGKLAAYARIAGIVASGLASLKSVSLSGGSSSSASTGSSTSGTTGATGGTLEQSPETTPQRAVTINISGNGNYTADQIEDLISAINDTDTSQRISTNRIAA